MADAVFTEVLELQIDVDSFAQGLQQLEAAYEEFTDRVNEKGLGTGNIINVGAFAELQSQLGQLQDYVQQFDSAISHSMEDLNAGMKQTQASVEQTAQATIDAKSRVSSEDSKGSGGSGGSGIPSSISAMRQEILGADNGMLGLIAHMVEFRLLWESVGGVINLVSQAITAPFEFLKQGFNYLTDIQDKAAELQGVIAATVQLSSDFATNFHLAGDAAKSVVQQLQDLSVQLNVPLESLERTFKAVLESGGMNFVHNLQGAVDVTKDLTLAMQASGASVDAERRIISEIPQLLSGQVPAHSKILEVLHLTIGEWQQIRTEALATGDLADVLAERLKPYLAVLDEAQNRQTALLNTIQLQGQRIAAAVALPLWQAFIGLLQQVKQFLEDHGIAVEALGRDVVGLGTEFAQLLAAVIRLANPFKDLHTLGEAIYGVFLATVFVARSLIDVLTAGVKQFDTFISTALDPSKMFSAAAWNTAWKDMAKDGEAAFEKIQDAAVDASLAMNGQGISNPFKDSAALLNQGTAKTAPLADDKAQLEQFKEMQQQFRTELDQTKAKLKEQEDAIKTQLETGNIDFHQAAQQRIAAINSELTAINQLVEKYKTLAEQANVPSKNKQPFLSQLQNIGNATQTDATIGVNDATATETKTEEEITQKHLQALRTMETQHANAMLAIYKQEADAGLHTKTEAFDHELAVQTQEHDAVIATLNDELLAAKNNAQQRSAILDQITAENQRYTDKTAQDANTRKAISAQETSQLQTDGNKELEIQRQLQQLRTKLAQDSGATATSVAAANVTIASAELKRAQAELTSTQSTLASAQAIGVKGDALQKLVIQELDAQKAVDQAQLDLQSAQSGTSSGEALQQIFGKGVTDLQAAFAGFDRTVQSMSHMVTTFSGDIQGFITAVSNGEKQGGILGGVGAGASMVGGIVSQFSPMIGGIMSAVGAVFSLIGGLFTAKAKEIADEIKQDVTNIQNSYAEGQTNLIQTITALQQQESDAIERLSGQKGGQAQLNTLLPELNQEISSLEQQQQQILVTFQEQVNVLQVQGGALGQFLTTWQQINDQVTQYLNAGGDANTAAQALSETLQQIVANTTASLQQADQTAVSDALNLNNLLLQRAQLSQQYLDSEQQAALQFEQQQFSLQNGQALERNAYTSATAQAIQLSDQQAIYNEQQQEAQQNYQTQLENLNSQISLAQQQVSLESQVFSIATDTATLQQQSNALTIQQLQTQITQWQEMQQIIEGINENSDGTYSTTMTNSTPVDTSTLGGQPTNVQSFTPNQLTPTTPVNPSNPSGVTIGTLTVNVNGDPTDTSFPQQLASNIYEELRTQGRYGIDTSYSS